MQLRPIQAEVVAPRTPRPYQGETGSAAGPLTRRAVTRAETRGAGAAARRINKATTPAKGARDRNCAPSASAQTRRHREVEGESSFEANLN
jgi:hypothetical protein